jgi:hypothetical protein
LIVVRQNLLRASHANCCSRERPKSCRPEFYETVLRSKLSSRGMGGAPAIPISFLCAVDGFREVLNPSYADASKNCCELLVSRTRCGARVPLRRAGTHDCRMDPGSAAHHAEGRAAQHPGHESLPLVALPKLLRPAQAADHRHLQQIVAGQSRVGGSAPEKIAEFIV